MAPQPPRVVVLEARPPTRTRSTPALHLNPRQRAAFHRWIVGYWLHRWLAGLPPAIPPRLLSVAQCIKDHESGDYGEHSHPSAGSGAFQFIPTTWRHWSELAGYPGFAFAYQAPASVQDAVLGWTLTHGGAGNWSNAYGFDPCTAGL